MKKLIEMTPEWVLENLSEMKYADGYGTMSIYLPCLKDFNLLICALKSLQISYKAFETYLFLDDLMYLIEFQIEDIKIGCPSVYEKMQTMNKNNLGLKLDRGLWREVITNN
jgi:hypothetical protein